MAFVPEYILILLVTILVDYVAGIKIESGDPKQKKTFLIISLLTTIGILFFFKYFNFFNSNIAALAEFLHWNYSIEALGILLPIGLSFHTFQGMSYIIEVYRGKQGAERHLGIYALYVMFYPQLVAGPIERPQNLLHQFHTYHSFEYKNVTDGLKLMAWGMFKKVVIADRLAVGVTYVYSDVYSFSSLSLFLATVFFAFQIYCDFSGYSDIARGSAQVMGFSLMKNFDRPYFSKSISEFWNRWHISLSTWFRDYVYIPLGGNRTSRLIWYRNIFAVFLISGLWHGANWTYIIWGALHGFYIVFGAATERLRTQIRHSLSFYQIPFISNMIRGGVTFILVLISWVFFRANSLSDALFVLQHMFRWIPELLIDLTRGDFDSIRTLYHSFWIGLSPFQFIIATSALSVLLLVHILQRKGGLRLQINNYPTILRWTIYYCLVMAIIIFGYYDTTTQQFIYFQF